MDAGGAELATPPIEPSSWQQSRLTGPRRALDPRVTAIRGDIVDIGLAGTVSASRYVAPARMICRASMVPMRALPDGGAVAVSAVLHGEDFDVFEEAGGWCWGRTRHDNYLGWVDAMDLAPPGPPRILKVTARSAPLFATADIKSPQVDALPLGSRIAGDAGALFVAVETARAAGFVHRRHLGAADTMAAAPIETARRFTGAPYVWGGRCPDGVDCSGLVQAALNGAGIACPRDADQQRDTIGRAVGFDDRQAGDIVCFPGHVGLLTARDSLFHANAHWMTTLEEPLADVIARLQAAGVAEPVTGVRRA